jgi:hypothetical protein
MDKGRQGFAARMRARGFTSAEIDAWSAVDHPWGEKRWLVDEAEDYLKVSIRGPEATRWFIERIAPKLAADYVLLGWSPEQAGVLHRHLQPTADANTYQWRLVHGEVGWLGSGVPPDQTLLFVRAGYTVTEMHAWLAADPSPQAWEALSVLAALGAP